MAMDKNTPEKLKPFIFHGVDLSWGQAEVAEGTCPLCDKENHFFVKKTTGQWSCKRCGEAGNIPTFLQAILDAGSQVTSDKDLEKLSKDRHVPAKELKAWGVVRHPFHDGDWLIPAYNDKGKLANIYRVIQDDGKWKALPTASCKLHPFFVPGDLSEYREVHITEGPWDGMAHRSTLRSLRKSGSKLLATRNPDQSIGTKTLVLAVPGSGTFKPEWFAYLKGKPATLYYDNDHPRKQRTGRLTRAGWDGMQRVAKLAGTETKNRPKSLSIVVWGKDGHNPRLADGYDLRDLIRDKGSRQAWSFLQTHTRKLKLDKPSGTDVDTVPDVDPIPRESFDQLCKDFQDNLHFHDNMRDTLAVMLAVVTSTTLFGDQVWFRVIGPPGSGKTTLAECLSVAKEYIIARSVLTGFHSGYTAGDGGRKKSASLIPRMKGKTLVVKDADTIVNSPSRDRILSELRDIYDGTSRAEYRNRQVEEHTGIQATFLLCGTDELRALNRTFLGERFLDCEILGDEEVDQFLDRAIDNTYDKILGSLKPQEEDQQDHEVHGEARTVFLQRTTYGYLRYLKDALEAKTVTAPSYSKAMRTKVKALANVLACVRAKVRREKDDLLYRPRKELGTRLGSQFTKLAVCLAIVLGKRSVDDEVFRILRKICLDTGTGFSLEIIQCLIKHGEASSKQLSLTLGLAESSVKRTLQDMLELKVLTRVQRPNQSGIRGRNLHLFHLTDEVMGYWKTAFGLPPKKRTRTKGA